MLDRPRSRLIIWFVAYLVAGLVAALMPRDGGLVPWYPPLAAAVGILLSGGLRWLPFVVGLEGIAAVVVVGADPAAVLVLVLPLALEATVAAIVLRRLALRFERGEDALALTLLAAGIALVGAATAAVTAQLTGAFGGELLPVFGRWWMCDVTTLLTLMPIVLYVVNRAHGTLSIPPQRHARIEIPAIFAVAVAAVALAFVVITLDPAQRGVLRTLWVIPILWMAVRYERLMASLVGAVMALVAFLIIGPTAIGQRPLEMVGLQASLIAMSVLSLMVSATLAGRRKATAQLEQALAALDESEQRYSHVFADSPAIQLLVDPDTRAIIDASEAAAAFYGWTRDELRTKRIGDLNIDAPEIINFNIARGRAGALELFVDHRKRSGEIRRMELRTGPIEIGGRLVLHSILRDATDEIAARAEIARLAAAVESSAESIITTDLDGFVTGWNGAAEQLYGYPREAALGRNVDALIGPMEIPPAELASMARDGRSIRFAHILRRSARGQVLPVDLTISPIIAEGHVVGMSRLSHDLREILAEEQRLRQSEALLADAAEVGRIGSWELDPLTGAATWSDELYRITGMAPGTPIDADTLRGLAHADDAARVELALRSHVTGEPLAFRLRSVAGDERSVVATWRLVAGSRGEGGRIVGVLRDVTEERALEERLRQGQRLESVGMLAGGVAHDFNNLLTAIAGFAELALGSAEDGESPEADLLQVQAAVERGRSLTSQLLTFSRRSPARPRPVNVGVAVHALVPMLRRLLGEDITILTELAPEVVAIVDPGQLDQVLVNLAVNARDAMPNGGRLRIAAGRMDEEARETAGPATVWIEVEDDGDGIPPELLDRIFLPFFTTKERGQGTGLGLATVQGIVTGADGRVDVSSRIGAGTVFRVELPGIAGLAAREEAAQRGTRITGEGDVLLVEDEDLVRQVAKRILERAGFRVQAAANAPDALEIAGRQRPDILVSDIVLPGIGDGISLAEELHGRWPDLPILLMTGYTERVPPSWAGLLTKPYEVDELVDSVRRLLDEAVVGAAASAARDDGDPAAGPDTRAGDEPAAEPDIRAADPAGAGAGS